MTFNDDANISKGRVSRRAKGGIAIGGGAGIIGIIALVVALVGGPDLTGLVGGLGGGGGDGEQTAVACDTGEQANESVDCRMQGASASLDDYWAGAGRRLPQPRRLRAVRRRREHRMRQRVECGRPVLLPARRDDLPRHRLLRRAVDRSSARAADRSPSSTWSRTSGATTSRTSPARWRVSTPRRPDPTPTACASSCRPTASPARGSGAAETTVDDEGVPYLEPVTRRSRSRMR